LPLVLLTLGLAIVATYSAVMFSDVESLSDDLGSCKWNSDPTSTDCLSCGNDGILKWLKEANDSLYSITNQIIGTETC